MFSSRLLAPLACGAVLASVAPAANAQTVYNSLSAFQTAATTSSLFTFEGIAASGGFVSNPNLSPLSLVVTGSNDNGVFANDSAYLGGAFSLNGTDSIAAGNTISGFLASTRINLGASYTAFATEFKVAGNGTNTYRIALYNDNAQVGSFSSTGNINSFFYGVTSATSFNNVRFTATQAGTGGYSTFDNVRIGAVAAVAAPEPSALALLTSLALPLAGMVIRERRSQRKA
jgi:hypothetical protein